MPKPQPRTDRVTLSALLTSGKLTGTEQRVFQGWYDDIMGGKRISLTPKERLWADSVYEKHKLGDVRYAGRKEARARIQKNERSLLDSMPRPLKPPGRS
jgi:hypothetical protein